MDICTSGDKSCLKVVNKNYNQNIDITPQGPNSLLL